MLIYLSLLIAIVGLLMYGFAQNAKLQEIGRITYFAGTLAFLLQVAPYVLSLLGKR